MTGPGHGIKTFIAQTADTRHECCEFRHIPAIENVPVVVILDEVHRCANILGCKNQQPC